MNRIKAVIKKEFAHILRDPPSLVIIFLMPIVMILIYGYAMSFDLNLVKTGIIDNSQSEISAKLIKKFSNNDIYQVNNLRTKYSDPVQAAETLIKRGELHQVIIVPGDFSSKIKTRRPTEIGVIIDGSDSNVANLVYQYNDMIIMDFISGLTGLDKILKINIKIYFNPEVKSSFFFIPGLIAVLLVMISALLTSMSMSREKESGSIDLIFISPIKSAEIIIGKTLPYILVSLTAGTIILLFAKFWFAIPIKGSLMVLFIFSVLYIFTGLSFGILISTIAPSQKTAMFGALLATLLPSIMLSGFIFPLDSLGPVLKGISHLVPAAYFLKIIRGVILKGADLNHFFWEGMAMAGFSIVLILLSMLKFNQSRKRLK